MIEEFQVLVQDMVTTRTTTRREELVMEEETGTKEMILDIQDWVEEDQINQEMETEEGIPMTVEETMERRDRKDIARTTIQEIWKTETKIEDKEREAQESVLELDAYEEFLLKEPIYVCLFYFVYFVCKLN